MFVDGLVDQSERFDKSVELLLVDWNPPPDRPALAEVLRWEGCSRLTARVVTVPPKMHLRYANGDRLPLFQMIAKNVGIRRARAPFVLSTNIDVVLSDELFRFICGPLERKTVYRTDRLDIDAGILADTGVGPADARSAKPFRVLRKTGTYDESGERVDPIFQSYRELSNYLLRPGFWKRLTRRNWTAQGISQMIGSAYRLAVLPRLHSNACGDFTLISKVGWSELHGYPEWEMYSWHIDTMILFQAAAYGFDFVELPETMPAFHIDHELGSGWSPEGEASLFARLGQAGIPYLSNNDLGRIALLLHRYGRGGRQPRFNLDDWGLSREELPEVRLGGLKSGV